MNSTGDVTVGYRPPHFANDAEAIEIAARIDKRQNRWDESLANMEKACELDPRNGEVAYHRRGTLLEMRVKELEQVLAKDAANGIIDGPWVQFQLAEAQTGRR